MRPRREVDFDIALLSAYNSRLALSRPTGMARVKETLP
jgi:hypothetical protein